MTDYYLIYFNPIRKFNVAWMKQFYGQNREREMSCEQF